MQIQDIVFLIYELNQLRIDSSGIKNYPHE
jgi:hypothetical protein